MANEVKDHLAALGQNPDDRDAIESLDRALVEAGQWADLVRHVAAAAEHMSDPMQRSRYFVRASHIARTQLSDDEKSAALLRRALTTGLKPEDTAAAFTAAFAGDGDWSGLVDTLVAGIEHAADDSTRARLFFRAGQVYETQLHDRERAIPCYQRAFKLDPFFTEPLARARAIYAEAQTWPIVIRLYNLELQVAGTDPRVRARLLREVAEIEFTQRGDRAAGVAALTQAYELDPTNPGLVDFMRRAGIDVPGDAAPPVPEPVAAPVMEIELVETGTAPRQHREEPPTAEVAAAPESSTAEVTVDVASATIQGEPLVAEPADSPEVTVDVASATIQGEPLVADLEPTAEEAAVSVEEPAVSAEEPVVAAAPAAAVSVEEPAASVDEPSVAAAVSVEESAVEAASAAAVSVEEPAVSVEEPSVEAASAVSAEEPSVAAAVSVEEPAVEAASAAAVSVEEPVVASVPPVAASVRAASPAARVSGPAIAVKALGDAPEVNVITSAALESELQTVLELAGHARGQEAASLYGLAIELGLRLGRGPAGLAEWAVDAVIASDDGFGAIKTMYGALYRQRAVWQAIADRLDEIDQGDPNSGVAGALYGVRFWGLNDATAAMALAPRAGAAAAFEAGLIEFASKGNWRKAQTALQDAATGRSADPETASYRDQAWLAFGLGNEDKALDSLRRVTRKDKADVTAHQLLAGIFRAGHKQRELAETIKALVPHMDARFKQAKLLGYRDLVRIYREDLNQDLAVVQTYQAMLEVDPADVETIDALAERLRALNRFPDLVELLRRKADLAEDDDQRVSLLREVAQLYTDKVPNPAEAARAWESILEVRPEDVTALHALQDTYERRRDWDQLIAVKRRLVDHTTSAPEQARLLREAAEVAATRKRDNEQAIELWNEVLAVVPDDGIALNALEQLYERSKEFPQLADILIRRAAAQSDAKERAVTLLKLGTIQFEKLEQIEAAVETYEQLIEVEPDNFRARDALRKAYIELERWDSLEAFYARDNKWDEYVRQIEALTGNVESDTQKVELLFRAADVWSDRLNDLLRATKVLEKILTIDPRNRVAAQRLAPTYEERGDYKRLPAMLEVLLENETDPRARYTLEVKLARLNAGRLREPEAAVVWFGRALDDCPEQSEVYGELEESARAAGDWAAVDRIYTEVRNRISTDPSADGAWTDATQRHAAVYEQHLHQPEEALDCLDELLRRDPSSLFALDARDRIFGRLERWDELLETLDTKLGLTTGSSDRVALLERICHVHEQHRDDVTSAIARYQDILTEDARHMGALAALQRLYRGTGDAHALAEVLVKEIALYDLETHRLDWVRLRIELARVRRSELDQAVEALAPLAEVVGVDPHSPDARRELDALLDDERVRIDVARLIEPLLEQERAWSRLVDVLEIRLGASTDDTEREGLLARIGARYRRDLHDPVAAADAFARLLQVNAAATSARDELEQIATETNDWSPVIGLYSNLVEELAYKGADAVALAVDYAERAARMQDTHAHDLDAAIAMWRRSLELSPARRDALEALAGLYTRSTQWEELLLVREELLGLASSDAERRTILFGSAVVLEQHIDDATRAIETYRRVLAILPGDDDALAEIDRLTGATGDAAEQARTLAQRIALSTDSVSRRALRNRLARIHESELGDTPTAIALWKTTLDDDPTDAAATSALEAQLEGDHALAACGVLQPLFEVTEQWGGLARVLEVELGMTTDPTERRRLFLAILEIVRTKQSDADGAWQVAERALCEFTGDAAVIEVAWSLAAELDRWERLADHLEAQADEAGDLAVQQATLVRVAGLREEKQGDVAAATALWERVHDADPYDLNAVNALERLYSQQQRWEPLVETQLKKADLPSVAADLPTRRALLFAAALLQEERLARPEDAIEVLRGVLGQWPGDVDAIETLERLYTATERWEDLVENYTTKIGLTSGDTERRELYFALGAVLEQQIDDPERAADAYRTVLGFAPSDLDALRALDRLYVRTENWIGLMDVLGREASIVTDDDQARGLRYRIGRLQESELGDARAAVATYRGVLESSAAHQPTRDALLAMITRGDEAHEAARILEPILRAEGEWSALIAINRTLIDATDAPSEQRRLYVDIAEVYETRLGDRDSAFDAYGQAARVELRIEELDQLDRIAGLGDGWEALGTLLEDLLEQASDPTLRIELGLRLGALRRDRLNNRNAAIEAFAAVHDEDPGSLVPLLALDPLYEAAANWGALADVLTRRIALAAGADTVPLRMRLARVQYECLGEPVAALEVYREILAGNDRDEAALQALEEMSAADVETDQVADLLEPIFRRHGEWARLVTLLEARIRTADSPDDRYTLHLSIAEIRLDAMTDPKGGMNSLGNALFERPSDSGLKDRIEQLAATHGRWKFVSDLYRQLLTQELSDDDALDSNLRMARVLDAQLGDATAAEAAYRAALEVEPGSEVALRALDRIYSGQQRWNELTAILARLRDVVYEPAELLGLATRQAQIAENELGDTNAAIGLYNEALDLDPAHGDSLAALVRLYTITGRHEDLYDTYDRQTLLLHTDAERVEILEKMAVLAADLLDRPDDAIDLWRRVLAVRPTDIGALEAIASLYRHTEQFSELASVLDQQIELTPDTSARAQLLMQAGALWSETLDNHDAAIVRYVRVQELIPDEPLSLAALRALYERVGDYERFASTVERMLTIGVVETNEQPALYEQLGEVYTNTLGRPVDAIRAWSARFRLVPTDVNALDQLETLHGQQGDWRSAVGVIEKKVELAGDDAERIDLLRRIGQIQGAQLNDDEAAVGAWERIVDLDITDDDAAVELERLYERLNEHEKLAALCIDRAGEKSVSERLELLRRAASIYETKLGQAEGAFLILRRAAVEAPLDEEILAEMARLAEVANRRPELATLYTELISAVASNPQLGDKAALPLLLASGALHDTGLSRPDLAEAYFDRALSVDAENEVALAALDSIYTRLEDWESLVGILRRRVDVAFESADQVAFFRRIGEACETRLGDTAGAVDAYKMVLHLDETDAGALGALERIYEASAQWRPLIEVLDQRAQQTWDPPALAALRYRIAVLWADKLGVADRAVDAYHEVLDVDPRHRPSLEALTRLYGQLENWDKLVDIYDQRLQIAESDAERVELLSVLARIHESAFDDIDRAVDALRQILAIDPRNIPAIEELERVFIDQERWSDLVDTYESHAAAVDNDESRASVLVTLAQTWVESLEDVFRGIEIYQRVLKLDEAHPVALERLGQLYEDQGDATRAIECFERLAMATPVAHRKRDLLFHAGELREGSLNDLPTAEIRYRDALTLDPSWIPAMQALQRIFQTLERWTDAIDMIQMQVDVTRDLKERANLLVQIAAINEDNLGNGAAAARLYEEALDLDPTNVYAASPLVEVWINDRKWERARSALELLIGSDVYRSDEESLTVLYSRLGKVNEELGLQDDAADAYEQALALRPAHLDAAAGLADIRRRTGRLDQASALYRDVLSVHAKTLAPDRLVAICFDAGTVRREMNDAAGARELFERGLKVDPTHEPTLRALLEQLVAAGDKRAATQLRQRLLDVTTDPQRRLALLIEIGDGFKADGNPNDAEKAYRDAVAIDPSSKILLHKLLDIFTETGNWRRATEVLGQLAQVESDSGRKAQYCFAIGAIFRDEMGEKDQAVDFFNRALDFNPAFLDPFEAIDRLLTSARDWKSLERNYRKMIERCTKQTTDQARDLQFVLARNLGEIYRSRVDDVEQAIAAYQYALSLRPNEESLYEILAELYTRSGKADADVVALHQKLLALSPFRIESYQALFNVYFQQKEFDRSWCMASALTVLAKASPEQEEFYKKFLPPSVPDPRRPLSSDVIRRMFHPELDDQLTAIFASMAVNLREDYSGDLKRWNVGRKNKVELTASEMVMARMRHSIEKLGVPAPEFYQRPDLQGVCNANAEKPALILGGDMFQGKGERELGFLAARNIALLRPEFYLASAFPATEHLKAFFWAAYALHTGAVPADAPMDVVTPLVRALQRLPEPVLVPLRNQIAAYLNSGRNPDLSVWLRAVDHTANRIGLLLCGDLRQSITCIKQEPLQIGKADIKVKVKELILYSISDDYFALRRELGLALVPRQ